MLELRKIWVDALNKPVVLTRILRWDLVGSKKYNGLGILKKVFNTEFNYISGLSFVVDTTSMGGQNVDSSEETIHFWIQQTLIIRTTNNTLT